eukprot:2376996-Pyramimonas_sp.AAC.2
MNGHNGSLCRLLRVSWGLLRSLFPFSTSRLIVMRVAPPPSHSLLIPPSPAHDHNRRDATGIAVGQHKGVRPGDRLLIGSCPDCGGNLQRFACLTDVGASLFRAA